MMINPEFEQERSHQDIKQANENARASGQAALLMNGGAATAILAFLTKAAGSSPPKLLAISLVIYALGAIFGARALWCWTFSLREFGVYHELRASLAALDEMMQKDCTRKISDHQRKAEAKTAEGNGFNVASFISFILATTFAAFGLW
jgi:hypothetical protein